MSQIEIRAAAACLGFVEVANLKQWCGKSCKVPEGPEVPLRACSQHDHQFLGYGPEGLLGIMHYSKHHEHQFCKVCNPLCWGLCKTLVLLMTKGVSFTSSWEMIMTPHQVFPW